MRCYGERGIKILTDAHLVREGADSLVDGVSDARGGVESGVEIQIVFGNSVARFKQSVKVVIYAYTVFGARFDDVVFNLGDGLVGLRKVGLRIAMFGIDRV